jgi:hypothetical protein
LIILIIIDYKLWSPSLGNFLQPPVTSSLFGPNIVLWNLFSNTISLCSSLNIKDMVSQNTKLQAILQLFVFSFSPF